MTKFAILFALVATATASPVLRPNALSPTDRIVGGIAAEIEMVPYLVSIQVFGVQICGGSIISSSYILTAGHCFVFSPAWYNVRSGSTSYWSGGTLTTNADIIIHEQYAQDAWGLPFNDIALIQLITPLTIDSTQSPIALVSSDYESAAGAHAVIGGWGALFWQGRKSDDLHIISVNVGSRADCNEVYSSWGAIHDNQICTGVAADAPSSCDGDTGGPVVINGVLAGVLSWANDCAIRGLPTVYTEVGAYRDWITTNSGV